MGTAGNLRQFRYNALTEDGRRMSGEIAAASEEEAASLLQETGVYVTRLKAGHPARSGYPVGIVPLSEQETIFLLKSWMMFLESGIPLQSSLLRLRMKVRNPSLARGLERAQRAIDGGSTLGEALQESRLFPSSWISTIEVGSERGELLAPLSLLYDQAMESRRFREEMVSILLMPSVLLGLVLGWLWLFFAMVVPSLNSFLSQMGGPLQAEAMMASLTGLLVLGVCWILPLFCVTLLFLKGGDLRGREFVLWGWIPPWLPVVGPLSTQSQLAVLTWALNLQVSGGVSLIKAIRTAGSSMPGMTGTQLLEVSGMLDTGAPVSAALESFPMISAEERSLILAGVVSGKLEEVLDRISRDAKEELLERVKRLTLLIRSFVVITTCILMGLVAFTFFGMITTSLSSFPDAVVSGRAVLSVP
ncbi:MAG: type II secretion system F family protein [Candidatus Omnitrophica bacterium]|nr:type II secretion system F family protein [Candidatus Omnitrophota bacterium]